MKYIKYLLPIILILVFGSSCEKMENLRFPEFLDAANVRIQVDPDYSSLDASDIANAKLMFSVFSENTNIESVVISASLYSFGNDTNYARREILRYTQSDFDSHTGAIRDVEFTSDWLAQQFGLTGASDLGGGDRFDFFNVTTLTNGMVFPDTILAETDFETINVTPNIVNNAATTSFSVGFTAYVACPVPAGFAEGEYILEQIDGPEDGLVVGSGPRWITQVVNLTSISPIERNFQGTYLTLFDGMDFNFLLVCGNVLVPTTGTGLSCGGPELFWQGANPPGTYDEVDDSEIFIKIYENIYGGCGETPGLLMTLKLTKIP